MAFQDLVARMSFHGYIYQDGIFYLPYSSCMTVEAAKNWLAGLA